MNEEKTTPGTRLRPGLSRPPFSHQGEGLIDEIRARYTDLSRPTAYSGNTQELLKGLCGEQRDKALAWLRGQEAYVLSRPASAGKGVFERRRTVVSGIDAQWQMDLADMSRYARQNKGYHFILTGIDVFSRWAFAEPIKDKSGREVRNAMERIFHRWSHKPEKIQTDWGHEFHNAQVKEMLKREGVELFASQEYDTKAALVERFHRTLKQRFEAYFNRHLRQHWLTVLPALVRGYNASRHRMLGTSLLRVMHMNDKELEALWEHQYPDIKPAQYRRAEKDQRELGVGDYVRLAMKKGTFEKGYTRRYTREVFRVTEVPYGAYRIQYRLEDLEGEPVEGTFYRDQLQRDYHEPTQVRRLIEGVVKRSKTK